MSTSDPAIPDRPTSDPATPDPATSDPANPDPAGVVTTDSVGSVEETVQRLVELIAARGLKLFAVIDQAAEAHQVGLELRPTTLVMFGSPVAGTPVMDAAPLTALDLPLRILVWAEGGQTKVTYLSPSALGARYGLAPDLVARLAGVVNLADALLSVRDS